MRPGSRAAARGGCRRHRPSCWPVWRPDPRTPEGYSASLELHAKLHSFPFIGLTVHGTSSYRKPGLYHYQLQNLPRIAAKFEICITTSAIRRRGISVTTS